MKERVVLITGATGGIGEGFVKGFAKAGYHVVIHTHQNITKARELKEFVLAQGQEALIIQAELEKHKEAQETIEHVLNAFGRLDVLINNAGLKKDAPIDVMDEADFDAVMNVNLKAVYNLIKFAVPPMKEAHFGRIINVSSGIAITGRALNVNYAASKAALHGLTKSLAKELGPHNITVNIIAPGLVETPMTSYVTEAQKKAYIEQVPMRRLGTPDDMAHAALFFADEASSFISNQILCVNGGNHSG